MHLLNPAAYGPCIEELLRPERLLELAVDPPYRAMHAQLEALEQDENFAPFTVRDRALAAACWAGLWLFFDFLDEAHSISQDLHTVEGSYWHAILHRREPDYDNAKYWFRRVGDHPIFDPLRVEAAKLAGDAPAPAAFLRTQKRWEPFEFIDLCEVSAAEDAAAHQLCREVQQVEWELLFEYCHRLGFER
jgi:hypothetical protein